MLTLRSRPASSPKKIINKQSPFSLGYRMPAEWDRHASTWLTWPTNKITWPGKLLAEVESIYLQMISALLPGEKVNLLIPDEATGKRIFAKLASKSKHSNLILHTVKTTDTWIRDYGPIFIKKRGQKAFTKWIFNAWGGKYKDLARDNGAVDKIKSLKNIRRFDVRIVMEGGSLDMNGQGTCLTTEQCLLNPNRNPHLSKKEIELYLRNYLGAEHIIWLKEGIEGDDTDGHVDDITRFVAPRRILTAVESDRFDKNHSILKDNLEILKRVTDADGKKFEIIELPMPGRVTAHNGHSGDRLPASYANFYVGNASVLVPTYNHANDKLALAIIRRLFPGRRTIGIECSALVYGLGSIHCVTQQEPA